MHRILLLTVVGGIALAGGCVQDHKPNVIDHPEIALVQIENLIPHAGEIIIEKNGFFVSADGLIVTCSHCLIDRNKLAVTRSDGQMLPAKFLLEDRDADIAILQVQGKEFPFLKLRDDDDLEPSRHVRVVDRRRVVHGMFDHWENIAKDMHITTSDKYVDSGAPVLADDGSVIGVIHGSFPGHESEYLATPIWQVRQMMPHSGGQ